MRIECLKIYLLFLNLFIIFFVLIYIGSLTYDCYIRVKKVKRETFLETTTKSMQ